MIHIHVDVDNLWMYEQEFGIQIYQNREYIYTTSLPVFLELLKKTGSKATFMIIGQDLELPACQIFCKKAVKEGHEIANHTWTHPLLFSTLSYAKKKQEIIKTHHLITKICGQKPVGFRGPGYYLDKEIITILQKLNYRYDSSILPGIGPLLMKLYATVTGKENRHKSFGRLKNTITRQNPYPIKTRNPNKPLIELPISVLPVIKLPIHTTFAYFFGQWYRQLILQYLKSQPKYLLYLFHAIDFVDLPVHNSTHPVIPLRYTFAQRMHFAENILEILTQLNHEPLQTSRTSIKSIPH